MTSILRRELHVRGLLVDGNDQDDQTLQETQQALERRLDRANILYLVLAQDCNFSCTYCPIPRLAEVKGKVHMPPETARTAIDSWAKNIQQDFAPGQDYAVIFYGGEPLLNRATVTSGIEHARRLQEKGKLPSANVNLMLSTNGVLLDPEYVRFLAQHHVSVTVGCDGPAEVHDANRQTSNGQSTFADVERSIRLLVSQGVQTFASVGVTPQNLDLIDNYSTFFKRLGVQKFCFNFLRGKLLFSLVPHDALDDYYERATTGTLANFENFNEQHLEIQVERKHQAFFERRFFPTDCNGYGNQIVVDPRGRVGNCPFTETSVGTIEDVARGLRLSSRPEIRAWRQRLPLYNPACRPCDAKSICGGGCAWNTLEVKGDPLAIDDAACRLTLKSFDRLIWSSFLRLDQGDE
ncbi:MAG: radical SAM protein [Pseudonocardiaceae bacterium]